MSLAACTNNDKENDAIPTPVTASFNQDFSLNYRQQATLTSAGQTELTVIATDLRYGFCPKNSYCFTADFVWPTLSVQDAQGQVQEVRMPTNPRPIVTPTLMDTTSIRANGQRYMLHYSKWEVDANCGSPQKKDIAVVLRVIKINTNGQ